MNFQLLPYPAIESLFWYLPIEICVILHDKYNFGPRLWREKIMEIYGEHPEELIFNGYLTENRMLACIYAEIDIKAKNVGGWTALHVASCNGYKGIVELLIENGININAKNKYGLTALHIAIYYGSKEIVELLIDRGIEINARDNNGDTALSFANIHGDLLMQTLFKSRGAIL